MKSDFISNGYRMVYRPNHPTAFKSESRNGYVYEHRYLMEIELGRSLLEGEVVHHLDCNKLNNRLENLLVLSQATHRKLHAWIDGGRFVSDEYSGWREVNRQNRVQEPTYCEMCGKTLQYKQLRCGSQECDTLRQRLGRGAQSRPSYDVLKDFRRNLPMTSIAKKYNVSDNAVRKWIKQYERELGVPEEESILRGYKIDKTAVQ